ncbi:hypothetical protein D3C72_1563330 [compost metagenome]
MAADTWRIRRLHQQSEGQRLPQSAHRGDRPGRPCGGGADPHLRDARARRIRRRRALALQGGRQGRQPVRGEDLLAAPAAGLARGHVRLRPRGAGRRVQDRAVRRHHLCADATGAGAGAAAGRHRHRLCLCAAHRRRPPLPRRQGRGPHRAAVDAAAERPARRGADCEGGRPVGELAARRLGQESSRHLQDPPVHPPAEPRRGARNRAPYLRARTGAPSRGAA